jgi:cobalt-zinc-cadmium efflux system outer membrane protein
MFRHILKGGLAVALAWVSAAVPARAQGPTFDTGLPPRPGAGTSTLGPPPGAGASVLGKPPGGSAAIFTDVTASSQPLSGRTGTTASHAPSSISNPNSAPALNSPPMGYAAPAPQPTVTSPSYGSYELPTGPDDDGPPDGLTLDQAIERLIRDNLDLKGKSYEIPQAEADILNAGLRANPVFYADGQLVPYGRYTRDKPGGQTQYDVNISYPLDVSRKRAARTLYATRAKRVIEAQYQDAVRNAIDQLYTAYVNVLSARQTVRYAKASVVGLTQLYKVTEELYRRDQITRADVSRVQTQLNTAEVGQLDAEEGLRKTKRDLGALLNIPPAQAEAIEIRGTIEDLSGGRPPEAELIAMAQALRPDIVAFRLGVKSAEANVRLQLANRFTDVYVLYQPYTLQDNSPYGLKSPISWALGVTVPLPVYNRNQGGIARAKLNVTQSQIELSSLERQAVTDVQQALYEYDVTAKMVDRIKNKLMPAAKMVRDDTRRLYQGGEVNVVVFLNAQREYQDTLKQYLDTVVRHRRSMLALNTVLGERIFP